MTKRENGEIRSDVKVVDLSELKPYIGALFPGTKLELAIVRFYARVVDNKRNALRDIVNYICNKIYGTQNVEYSYSDLTERVNEDTFINIFFRFFFKLETILLQQAPPSVVNIYYKQVVDLDNLVFKFRYTYATSNTNRAS